MNIYDYSTVTDALGLDVSKLGCVMLRLHASPIDMTLIEPEWLYAAEHAVVMIGYDHQPDEHYRRCASCGYTRWPCAAGEAMETLTEALGGGGS